MKKPYFNEFERLLIYEKALNGGMLELNLAWQLFIREIKRTKLFIFLGKYIELK